MVKVNEWYINPNTDNYQMRLNDGSILTVDFQSAHAQWIEEHPLQFETHQKLQQDILLWIDKEYWMTRIGNGSYFV